jgi:ABC-2 type transport system permease protein
VTGLLWKVAWVELKLFVREPVNVVFTLALPLLMFYVLAGVFGNEPETEEVVFRGVGGIDYYTPAYIGLVVASLGVIGLPVHIASYREAGVLRRFRASGLPVWVLAAAQTVVTFILSVAGTALVLAAAFVGYDVHAPDSIPLLVLGFVLSVLVFASVGFLLGAVLPSARAAQGAGIALFFVMLMLGGAGPPPEVMPDALEAFGKATPLQHLIVLLQDAWLGFGWNEFQMAIAGAFLAGSIVVSLRSFRWE